MYRKLLIVPFLLSVVATQAQHYYIRTVAGVNSPGYSGDGGPATVAMIYSPLRARPDKAGNLLIADSYNNVIRKVSASGYISTIAGNGTVARSGDGGMADTAAIESPVSILPTGLRSYYLAEFAYDSIGPSVRFVNDSGIITTIAGGTGTGYYGDGGPASAAQFVYITDIMRDRLGRLYVTDGGNNTVRMIDTTGIITTIAGIASAGHSGDGGPATAAEISYPSGIAIDSVGNLYIADEGNNMVRKIDTAGIITTIAGNGALLCAGDGGPATAAGLSIQGLEVDRKGNLYLADWENARIRKIDSAGLIHTIAGNGMTGYTGDGGPATAAQMMQPFGVALDTAGNVFVADYASNLIRELYPAPPASLGIAFMPATSPEFLSVWPDPNQGHFQIAIPGFEGRNGTLSVVQVTGRLVYTANLTSNQVLSLDLCLEPGLYIVRLQLGGEVRSVPFSVR